MIIEHNNKVMVGDVWQIADNDDVIRDLKVIGYCIGELGRYNQPS